ncbi:LacI family DNA-binding transcriptional regulator [Ktedonospora formicarum]|uniref:LacI family transcriptional regulator n=1 Tax=Ktedonospora formicarum TaxID=2778364 RepID=A0A8J3I4G9_9CHLR|nr:LacI family DNA-binding transcriptional regulator [Ktedonospora formicarum]GHO46530.1 LacI family transcriptional regulator [Ktedonospora formicarum]
MSTIQDVAKYAGVSISTVSRVLNGTARVNPDVMVRVRTAIEALNYQPSRAARALRSNQSSIIGLLITDIQNPFFTALVRGVEDVAQRNGYSLILCNSDENPLKEQQYIEVLCSQRVAGAIVVPTREQAHSLQPFRELGIPALAVDRRVKDPDIDTVVVDNQRGAYEAVKHLCANGYQRIGVVTGPQTTTTGRERLLGYRRALIESGITPDPQLERQGPFKMAAGQQFAGELLDLDEPVDALFVANNLLTIGALEAISMRNMRIPEDIAIVAFDDIPWAALGSVSLTTVTQPVYELGSTAALRLFQRMQKGASFTRQEIVLSPTLHVRNSSQPRQPLLA